MDQRVIDAYDAFTHGGISRRELLERLALITGSAVAAAAILPSLRNDYALAAAIPEDDARLATETTTYDVSGARGSGYLARKKGGGRRPGVVVIHENRGLNPHIKDVARRLAVEGYLALAVDALSGGGGTPAEEDKAREMIGALDPATALTSYVGAVAFLAKHGESTGKVGAVGFCWGGAMANRLAAAGTALAGSVAYYGRPLPPEEAPKVTAPLLLHCAGKDERTNAGIPAFRAALDEHRKPYELYVYEGAQHAFNNDTNAARYDKASADLAWGRTLAFLAKHLA